MLKSGNVVTVLEPPGVGRHLPIESRRVFEHCVARAYRIKEITADGSSF